MEKRLSIWTTLCVVILLASCSTEKNTPVTRRVQSFKARYNTYFNGHQAYLEGIEAQRTGNKDNYLEILPFYMIGNKGTQSLGKSNFDRAVEKCQKTIKQHSITKRPEIKGNKRKSAKQKAWLNRKEYNPFLYKAWFLMGESQFRQGNFMEAASTFSYIQRLYATQPDIVAKARLLEARCDAELGWIFDAENLVNRAVRDSFPPSLEPLKAAVLADCQLRQERYEEAIPNIRRALKQRGSSFEKARLHFLLGQLLHAVGQDKESFREFKKVYRRNPPYELEFNARIQQTEVMSGSQSRQMIRKLQSMAHNPKNKDYLDQVYYAIGNIYLSMGDTIHAIWAYKDGVEKSTRNGIAKGIVWLHLGELYWQQEEFVKAQACYAGVMGLFDKEREDYALIDGRAKILEELLPHASAIELQDSLQELARMDSVERLKVIERIIEEVKKKEKEEQRNATAAEYAANNAGNAGAADAAGAAGAGTGTAGNNAGRNPQTAAMWYFYNPTAVAAGKQEFQRKWGQRKLEDHWRRKNKTVLRSDDEDLALADSLSADTDSLLSDSVAQLDTAELSEEELEELKKQEEYAKDPHRPEYYLKDIPMTDEQMTASNAALVAGLFNAAVIYKDQMENFPLAERTFQRVLIDFPDFEQTDEVYYNLFQLYSRIGRQDDATVYRDKLLTEFPENEHAILVADPYFEFKGRYGKQIEDSLYQVAYDAFVAGNYDVTIEQNSVAAEEYPRGANRARFLFLDAMSRLERGEREQFYTSMKSIVDQYPQSTVSELAGLYVKGLKKDASWQAERWRWVPSGNAVSDWVPSWTR